MRAVTEHDESSTRTIKVLFTIHSSFEVLELCGPLDVLGKAPQDLEKPDRAAFQCVTVSTKPTVTSSTGLTIKADIDFTEAHKTLDQYDVLVLPGGPQLPKLATVDAEPIQLIKAFVALQVKDPSRERTLLSTGNGSLVFGHAGILQGLSATTHPDYYTKLEIICQEAARRGQLEQTNVMEENYVVNNARFDLGENIDENPFVLSKRPQLEGVNGSHVNGNAQGGRRASIARRGSNAWKESMARRESNARRASLKLGGLRVITSRGGTSALDVSLYLVAAMVSHEIAEEIARNLRFPWDKGVTVEGIDV